MREYGTIPWHSMYQIRFYYPGQGLMVSDRALPRPVLQPRCARRFAVVFDGYPLKGTVSHTVSPPQLKVVHYAEKWHILEGD